MTKRRMSSRSVRAHRGGRDALLAQPRLVDLRNDLRWLDLAPAAPEHVGVTHWNANSVEMAIDRALVREHGGFLRAVRDGHDVDVRKLRPAFSPVRMRENVVTAHLASRLDLPTFRAAPVEECVVAWSACAAGRRSYVFEKGGEASDHPA